jgi:hypothetical protein
MSDVTIKYNNNTIGELNDTGAAVLLTAGKKCIRDIEIDYTKLVPEIVSIPVYTQLGDEGSPAFAKNISAAAGEAINDTTIPLPADVDKTIPVQATFHPGTTLFNGKVSYTLDNTILIEFYMPNRMPNNADKLVIIMQLQVDLVAPEPEPEP